MSVRIETNIGHFIVELFCEDAPKASQNFLKLCKLNYYSHSIFLRCEPNFLLQGGDPTNTGTGGSSVWQVLSGAKSDRFFADEIDVKKRKHLLRGTLSMASAGKDRNASQFFLTLADSLDFLDGTCTVFGQLTSAKLSLIKNDNETSVESSGNLDSDAFFDYFNDEVYCDESCRPFQDVFITDTIVLSDPFPDPEGFSEYLSVNGRISGSEPTPAFTKHKRIGAHESLNDSAGKTEEELAADLRERAAKSNALVLELIGDLPSADVKPPENVLFICKLNPITRSEDLKMIFSRFGSIVSCEVIKDRDTGSSLGYAFIEFDEKESCEQAYLKMDNVLIDDRRVKVDFSQSVSKLHKQWEDKRRGITKHDNGRVYSDSRRNDTRRNDTRRYDTRRSDTSRSDTRRDYNNRQHYDNRDYDKRRYRERSKSPRR